MQTTIFFVFEPTSALHELASSVGQEYLAQQTVWLVSEHDRVGAEYSNEELSQAHWVQFVANIIGDRDETDVFINFRNKCLALGFAGCWNVFSTKLGGNAKELMEESQLARNFLAQRGISF